LTVLLASPKPVVSGHAAPAIRKHCGVHIFGRRASGRKDQRRQIVNSGVSQTKYFFLESKFFFFELFDLKIVSGRASLCFLYSLV